MKWRVVRFLAALVAVSVCAGCILDHVAPSVDIYYIGVARLGNDYVVYAPLCADERIEEVVVFDSSSVRQVDDDAYAYDEYWVVQDPTAERVAQGWILIGDNAAFDTVVVSLGSELPPRVGVELVVRSDVAGYSFAIEGGGFGASDNIPSYPARADPTEIDYGFRLGSRDEALLSPSEMRNEVGCARDNLHEPVGTPLTE